MSIQVMSLLKAKLDVWRYSAYVQIRYFMQNFVNLRTRENHDNKYQTAHPRTSEGLEYSLMINTISSTAVYGTQWAVSIM